MEPELTDGRIVVRPYTPDDLDALYEGTCESIPEVSLWLDWCHPDYRREESEQWIRYTQEAWASAAEYQFGIFAAAGGEFLGGVGINQINPVHRSGNLGYWVRSSRVGEGIASAAAWLVARFGLTSAGLVRIEIVTLIENVGSQRVAEKIDAVREGVLRHRLVQHGTPHDAVMFSLTSEDLERR